MGEEPLEVSGDTSGEWRYLWRSLGAVPRSPVPRSVTTSAAKVLSMQQNFFMLNELLAALKATLDKDNDWHGKG